MESKQFNLLVVFMALLNPLVYGVESNYKLVWCDEFNANGTPNAENWTFEQGFVRNEELQWYQPENAFPARCEIDYVRVYQKN